jgi:hypothetical protein
MFRRFDNYRIDEQEWKWIQEDCENQEMRLAIRTGGWAKGLQIGGKCVEDSGLDGEESELPFPAYIDEAAGLKFLDVVRESGWRDGEGFVCSGASEGTTGASDLLKELEALGISERFQNGGALGSCKTLKPCTPCGVVSFARQSQGHFKAPVVRCHAIANRLQP